MPTPTDTIKTITDINGVTYNLHGVLFGLCITGAATAAKAVSIPGITSLAVGLSIRVMFTSAQTYNGAPTLNVNSLGAKTIKRYGTTNAAKYEWAAGEVVDFVYDGTYWVMVSSGLAKSKLPEVTSADNGKVLRVVDGAWAAAAIPSATGVSF